MSRFFPSTVALALLWLAPPALRAEAPQQSVRVGDTYEITMVRDWEQKGGLFSGNSHDDDVITERVIAVRPGGLELEYDLPADVPAEQRAGQWEFPVRVFRPDRGPLQLLNGPELEARVNTWLKAAKWPRSVCGHWIFTWNAFRIECDPQSVLKTIEAMDPRADDLRDGAQYREAEAIGPGTLARKSAGPDEQSFAVVMQVDPDAIRRSRAESDVVAGEITRKPVTLEAALRAHSQENISGTITVTFDADGAGNVRRKTSVTRIETKEPGGAIDNQTFNRTVERRLISRSSGQP